jgi:histidine ammonia-lyase
MESFLFIMISTIFCYSWLIPSVPGTPRAFEACIHGVRPHVGQVAVAARLFALLTPPSDLFKSHNYMGKVQDAYSLRCAPQVHGIVHDTIGFVEGILDVELNSATDNPMVFTPDDGAVLKFNAPSTAMAKGVVGSDSDNLRERRNGAGGTLGAREGDSRVAFKTFKRPSDTFYEAQGGFIISGGNFHG